MDQLYVTFSRPPVLNYLRLCVNNSAEKTFAQTSCCQRYFFLSPNKAKCIVDVLLFYYFFVWDMSGIDISVAAFSARQKLMLPHLNSAFEVNLYDKPFLDKLCCAIRCDRDKYFIFFLKEKLNRQFLDSKQPS